MQPLAQFCWQMQLRLAIGSPALALDTMVPPTRNPTGSSLVYEAKFTNIWIHAATKFSVQGATPVDLASVLSPELARQALQLAGEKGYGTTT